MFKEAETAFNELKAAAEALSSQMDAVRVTLDAQSKVLVEINRRLSALEKAPEPAPVPAPAPEPAPEPAPGPVRDRDAVTRLVLSEFAKQTSFIPGGGDIVSPDKAIQLWTTGAIEQYDALNAPEDAVRAALAQAIRVDVQKYGWDKSHPPKGDLVSFVVVSGAST